MAEESKTTSSVLVFIGVILFLAVLKICGGTIVPLVIAAAIFPAARGSSE